MSTPSSQLQEFYTKSKKTAKTRVECLAGFLRSNLEFLSIVQRKFVPGFNGLPQYFKQLGIGQNIPERIYAQLH